MGRKSHRRLCLCKILIARITFSVVEINRDTWCWVATEGVHFPSQACRSKDAHVVSGITASTLHTVTSMSDNNSGNETRADNIFAIRISRSHCNVGKFSWAKFFYSISEMKFGSFSCSNLACWLRGHIGLKTGI